MHDLGKAYVAAWTQFGNDLQSIFDEIGDRVASGSVENLHGILRSIYSVPYEKVRKTLEIPLVNETSENIGSITGLFFEQSVMALVVPFIRRAIPNARFKRNKCSSRRVRALSRDPDLYVKSQEGEAVIEVKVAPKKGDLEHLLQMRERHEAIGVGYYLVGGYVSASATMLGCFRQNTWACFMESSKRNESFLKSLPTLDSVIQTAVKQLVNN